MAHYFRRLHNETLPSGPDCRFLGQGFPFGLMLNPTSAGSRKLAVLIHNYPKPRESYTQMNDLELINLSNQAILWASVALAWLSTLLLKQEELRRYMPVALFCSLAFAFIFEMGISLQWWAVKEATFPLINIPIFIYGPYLIGTIWIFKYTYGRFWLFLVTNIVLDYFLVFFLIDWFIRRGVWEAYISYFQGVLVTVVLAVALYGYQLWQSGDVRLATSSGVQPAAAKPLEEEQTDKP